MNTSKVKLKSYFNQGITALFYILFPVITVSLWQKEPNNAIHYGLTCFVSFLIVSAVRHIYNAPRPWEKDPTLSPPPGKEQKKGHSFPSRHVFSAFVITTAAFYFYPRIAMLLYLPAIALAWLRVDLGYHFKKDVIWGAIFGIGCGIIGMWLLG